MSKSVIEINTSGLDENSSRNFHYHLDHFIRQMGSLVIPNTVTHSGASIVVDPSPLQTKGGEESPDSASPTGGHKKP